MSDRAAILKMIGALAVASIGIGSMCAGGSGVVIGGFLSINAFLVLGALVWV
jgi:hypothetical protein